MAMAKRLNIKELHVGVGEVESILNFLYDDKALTMECQFTDPLSIISCLRSGLPKAGINNFLEKTAISRAQLSPILNISNSPLDRYDADDRLSPEQSNVLYELTRIYIRAVDIIGNKDSVEHWLNRSQQALGGQIPLQMLDTTEGMKLVENLLSQIEYSSYS
jgi:putative toxin-antitoxin system antitoxin component (TIGR02293 family)